LSLSKRSILWKVLFVFFMTSTVGFEVGAFGGVGACVGVSDGLKDGKRDGIKDGKCDGIKEGKCDGMKDGKRDGVTDGVDVCDNVEIFDGLSVGDVDGLCVAKNVGLAEG